MYACRFEWEFLSMPLFHFKVSESLCVRLCAGVIAGVACKGMIQYYTRYIIQDRVYNVVEVTIFKFHNDDTMISFKMSRVINASR